MSATPIAESGPWSLGTLVGLPLAVASIVALTGLGVWLLRKARSADDIDGPMFKVCGWAACGSAVLTLIGALSPLGMYPYDSEYHQWRDVAGVVQQADSRQIADGKGMSQRFVFTIAGQPFSVDDTRAAAVREGDAVNLRCKREWQYAADSGWACRWAGASR